MPFRTERLRVRHVTLGDVAEIWRLSREPGMRRFLPDQVYADEAEARRVLEFLIAQYADPNAICTTAYVQAVELANGELADGELIGHVGFSPIAGGVELGYAIAEAHQGQGYATELVRGALSWAFGSGGLGAVLAVVDHENHASIRVLEKAGFRLVDEQARALHGRQTVVRTYRVTRHPQAD